MIKLKEGCGTALRALLLRKRTIFVVLGIAVAMVALWLLLPLIPQQQALSYYRVGELQIPSLTEAVGYRKVLSVSQSLSGLGRAESGSYSYKAGSDPRADVERYCALLQKDLGAQLAQNAQLGDTNGSVQLTLPAADDKTMIVLEIAYTPESYELQLDEKPRPREGSTPGNFPVNVTPEQAKELVLSLTKAETGFKADISVYTTNMEPDTVTVDGWDYYVFTVVADYSATRVEHRGTYYVGCYDGVIMSHNKDTGETSRVRGVPGEGEAAGSASQSAAS